MSAAAAARTPLIGGHVSTRGGIDKSVDNAVRIGAEVIQTHPTPSQTWTPLRVDDIVLTRYREKCAAAGIRGHYLHAVYLINLATPKAMLVKQSIGSLVHRHTNIGDGEIGLEGFRLVLQDERLRRVPWMLEVPGTDGSGPDRDNINRLRECAGLQEVR